MEVPTERATIRFSLQCFVLGEIRKAEEIRAAKPIPRTHMSAMVSLWLIKGSPHHQHGYPGAVHYLRGHTPQDELIDLAPAVGANHQHLVALLGFT